MSKAVEQPREKGTYGVTVTPYPGKIKVMITGKVNEIDHVKICLSSDATAVKVDQDETLTMSSQAFTYNLPSGTYDVTVTQNGTPHNFLNQVVG